MQFGFQLSKQEDKNIKVRTHDPRKEWNQMSIEPEILREITEWKVGQEGTGIIGGILDYIPLVIANPRLADLSHARVHNMVVSHGVEWEEDEDSQDKMAHYRFFEDEIYGLEGPVGKIVDYFNSGSRLLPTRKRILMLMGPVGGGKSTIASKIKRGLAEYTASDEGAVFAIVGCPLHEDPLHLLPEEMRRKMQNEHGIFIEGDLCPVCQWSLKNTHGNDWRKFQIEKIIFSEASRTGVGTFTPSDPKCLAMSTLVHTTGGILSISEIRPDGATDDSWHEQGDLNIIDAGGDQKKASHYFHNGVQSTIKIRTSLGFEVECTNVHPLMVLDEREGETWRDAKNIRVGDKVKVLHSMGVYGENREIGRDLARLIGYWVAEGSIYAPKNNIEFSTLSEWMAEDILSICKEQWGYETKYRDGERVILSKKEIANFWIENILDGETSCNAYLKTVPKCIRTAPKDVQIEFLRGLFGGDGSFRERSESDGYIVSIGSASKTLLRQVQMMLLNMGYVAGLSSCAHGYNGSTQWDLHLYGDQAILFANDLKMCDEKVVDGYGGRVLTGRSNFDLVHGVRNEIAILNHSLPSNLRNKYARYGNTHSESNQRSFTKDGCRRFLSDVMAYGNHDLPDFSASFDTVKNACEGNAIWLDVISVEDGGRQEVGDLTVPESHSFVSNGIVSHNTQDIAELIGSINLARLGDIGRESDPNAFEFDGEIEASNRGVLEMIEMLKCDVKFLHTLLTVTQEQQIKTPRFPMVSVNVCVMAHTNETEWRKFMSKPENEALQDRIITVPIPYVLKVSDEMRIYKKELRHSKDARDIVIAPRTLDVCSMFAVLSRLEPPKDQHIDLVSKMKAYDGKEVQEIRPAEIRKMRRESENEGMSGIGPREIMNAISQATTQARDALRGLTADQHKEMCFGVDVDCEEISVDAIDILQVLMKSIHDDPKRDVKEKDKLGAILEMAKKEFNEMVLEDIQEAFCYEFEEDAANLFKNYLTNVVAYCNVDKIRDSITDDLVDPDERLMTSVEEMIGVAQGNAKSFRESVAVRMAKSSLAGKMPDFTMHADLRDAIRKRIFEDRKDIINITTSTRYPDPKQLEEINRVIRRLVEEKPTTDEDCMIRYTVFSAARAIRYVGKLMNRG